MCHLTVHRHWRMPIRRLPLAVIDVETTGLDPRRDRVVEIAILVDGEPTLHSLVRPRDRHVTPEIHGISSEQLRDAPTFDELARSVLAALGGRLATAHHAAFDVAFLHAELRRAGHRPPALPYLCTLRLPDLLELDHERRNLAWACARYGITHRRPHSALDDARAAASLAARYLAVADRRRLRLADLARRSPDDACARSWRHGPWPTPAGRTALPEAGDARRVG